MAGRIPEIQRRQFVSSAVGTPGVDNTMSDFADSVGKVVNKYAESQAKADANRKEASIKSANSVRELDWISTVDQTFEDSGRDYKKYNENIKKVYNKRLEEIEDDDERRAFAKTAGDYMVSQSKKYLDRSKATEVRDIQNDINKSIEGSSIGVGMFFRRPHATMDENMEDFWVWADVQHNNIEKNRQVLGNAEADRLKKKSSYTMAKAGINAILDQEPERLDEFINEILTDEESFGSIFTPDELNELREYGSDLAKARKVEADKQRAIKQGEVGLNWASRLAKGESVSEREIALSELSGISTPGMRTAVRNFKKSTQKKFIGDNPQGYSNLMSEFTALGGEIYPAGHKKKKKGEAGKISEEVSFEKIATFYQHTVEAMEEGSIGVNEGQTLLDVITPKFNEKMEETFKSINNITVTLDWWDETSTIIKGEEAQLAAKARLQNSFLGNIDRAENKLGRRINMQEAREIFHNTKKEFVHYTNPNRTLYALGETFKDANGQLWKVVAFDTDGTPVVEDDLTAPVDKDLDDIVDKFGLEVTDTKLKRGK